MNDYIHIEANKTEVNVTEPEITINTGIDTLITIEKYFGPLIANSIRVHLDYESVCWIIERERIIEKEKSRTITPEGITIIDNDIWSEWDEVARIDANVWEEEKDT
jgi:hypothetical protein